MFGYLYITMELKFNTTVWTLYNLNHHEIFSQSLNGIKRELFFDPMQIQMFSKSGKAEEGKILRTNDAKYVFYVK